MKREYSKQFRIWELGLVIYKQISLSLVNQRLRQRNRNDWKEKRRENENKNLKISSNMSNKSSRSKIQHRIEMQLLMSLIEILTSSMTFNEHFYCLQDSKYPILSQWLINLSLALSHLNFMQRIRKRITQLKETLQIEILKIQMMMIQKLFNRLLTELKTEKKKLLQQKLLRKMRRI